MNATFTYGDFARPWNTCMDREELAYPAGSLRQSRRYARVLFSDAKVRKVKLGIADTFFTVPARVTIRGKTISGYVSGPPSALSLWTETIPEETLCFYALGKNKEMLPAWPDSDAAQEAWTAARRGAV